MAERKLTKEELTPTPVADMRRPLPARPLERHERIEQELEAARREAASKPVAAKDPPKEAESAPADE